MHHNYPAVWVKAFSESRLHEVDPVLTYAEQHLVPFFWNDPRFRAQLKPDHRIILAAAGTLGIRHGFTVPIHGPGERGEPSASCSFVLDSGAMDERSCFIAQLLAASFYEAARNAVAPGKTIRAPTRLSQPERECLELAAQGLTDWQVSGILKISESAVRTHIGHAMQRLGTPSREQAIAQALARRLIRFGDILRPYGENELRVTEEAAYWFMRLDDGELDDSERLEYARWLEESPAHAEALQDIQQRCTSLHANRYLLSRGSWRTH